MMHWARWSATVAVAALVAAPLCGQGSGGAADPLPGVPPHAVVTNDMLLNAAASGDWLMYGHNYWNNRFSPLKTINTANVKNLVPRAVYTHGSERLGSFETTPIVVNGVMYITSPATPNNIVRAFDLRTQKMLWHYEHKNGPVSTACCGPNNRGVAVSGGSVFVGTLDDYLVALDATTGKVKWEAKVGDGPEAGYTETMAPLVIGDNVIIGTSGAEYGIRGYVKSFNAATGAAGWTWYTLPSPEEGGWWGKWSKTTGEGDDLKRDIAKEKADAATGKLIRRSQAFVPQQNMYTQPTADGVFMLPGANGGQEWSPIAVHPDLAYAYTVGLHQPMHYKVHYAPWEKGRLWLGSAFIRVPDDKGGYSGEYGTVGAIATAGGLVFAGEGNGWFKAYDAKTGTVLWKFYCGAGANAAPSVFELDGEQFIAVAAGGNFQLSYPLGNSLFVFGLPKAGM